MKWILYLLTPILLWGSPQEELYQLFGISPSGSPDSILENVQRLWMQQGKERWEFENRYEHLRSQTWPLFQKIGMVDEIRPLKNHYETVLILGALLPRVEERIRCLESFPISFDQIVFLSGERGLRQSEKERFPELKTESEMVRRLYQESDIPKEIPVLFIEVPMKGERRPNTLDTVEAWLKTNPSPKGCLAISNQPYIRYQDAVLKRLLPFSVETAGSALAGFETVDLMLDTLAREITYRYGEIEWLQK